MSNGLARVRDIGHEFVGLNIGANESGLLIKVQQELARSANEGSNESNDRSNSQV